MPFVPWILGNHGMVGGAMRTHAALDLHLRSDPRGLNPDGFIRDIHGLFGKHALSCSRLQGEAPSTLAKQVLGNLGGRNKLNSGDRSQ